MNPEGLYPDGVRKLFPAIQRQLDAFEEMDFIARFNRRDVTLWSNDPGQQVEIAQRLGWLDAAQNSQPLIGETLALLEELLEEGYTHAIVLGMGGSSLAPEVYSLFAQSYGLDNPKSLHLSILDSTSPQQINQKREDLPLDKTLFIISSKSGTTVEVNTLFEYFWDLVKEIDPQNTGKHFMAIGDPDTKIQNLAIEKQFRKVIAADPNVGGRYSALIAFGLVPAMLAGFDGEKLLERSLKYSSFSHMKTDSSISHRDGGMQLGVVMGAAYREGMDKLTLLADPQTASLGSWIEQLVAESSGKDGRGILPVDQEARLPGNNYQSDRLFIYLRKDGSLDEFVSNLMAQGHPVYTCLIEEVYDLPAEFYRWEIATAVACVALGVNAFDQPNVQESKDIAKQMLAALRKNQELSVGAPIWKDAKIALFGQGKPGTSLSNCINAFLEQGLMGDFVAINAFIARNARNEAKLQELRKLISERTGLPTTMGFGPRFLHSTGQLHKGGKNNGLFIVISRDEQSKLEIPGEGITFNDLITAQALGDTHVLEQHARRVIRLHFSAGGLDNLDLKELF